jgi:hypothetical protein
MIVGFLNYFFSVNVSATGAAGAGVTVNESASGVVNVSAGSPSVSVFGSPLDFQSQLVNVSAAIANTVLNTINFFMVINFNDFFVRLIS